MPHPQVSLEGLTQILSYIQGYLETKKVESYSEERNHAISLWTQLFSAIDELCDRRISEGAVMPGATEAKDIIDRAVRRFGLQLNKAYAMPAGYFYACAPLGQKETQISFGCNMPLQAALFFISSVLDKWGFEIVKKNRILMPGDAPSGRNN
jgi:hypothetical protein